MSKKYACPYCKDRYDREKLISHIDRKHKDLIPPNYSATRVAFEAINKKTHGNCVVCKKPTTWNEKTCKFNRLCGDPKCTKTLRDNAKKNHIKVYGTSTLLNDPIHQEKMLANRKISGKYKFSDGGIHTYTGQYELKCLEFFDKVVGAKSDEVISPGPILEYKFKGVLKKYISDIYYVPYNLIIECKDGGDNPNKREMEEYRAKTIAKEEMITNQGKYNYLRLTNNNFEQLLEVLAELKMNLIDNDDSKIIKINESSEGVQYIPDDIDPDDEDKKISNKNEIEKEGKEAGMAPDSLVDPRNVKIHRVINGTGVHTYKWTDQSMRFMDDTQATNMNPNDIRIEDAVYGEYKNGACMITIMPNQEYEEDPVIGLTTDPSMSQMMVKDKEGLKCMPIDSTDDPRNVKVYRIKDGKPNHTYKWDDPARNLYEIVSEHEMLCPDQIDYDDMFERIDINIESKRSDIIYNSIIEEAHSLMNKSNQRAITIESEKFKIDLWKEGRALENSDIYKDNNGYYIKNESNNNRTKSYKHLKDISPEELYIVDNEPVHIKEPELANDLPLDSNITYINLPFFSPTELNDFGYYNGEAPELKSTEIKQTKSGLILRNWFEAYKLAYYGLYTEEYSKLAPLVMKTLYKLQEMYDNNIGDKETIKEDMIKLGWNPVMRFNSENMVRAFNRNRQILLNNTVKIVDIDSIKEAKTNTTELYPVYVVLVEGKMPHAKLIQKFQKGNIFTHVAISLDETLDEMYSFNANYIDNIHNNRYSGFSIETIKNLKNKQKISVYAIFTTKEIKASMRKNIENLRLNIRDTSYSGLNLVGMLLDKDIDMGDRQMICSQFVDSMLKLCHMNNKKKSSGLVAPSDIYDDLNTNNKAYKVYEDLAEKYKSKIVLNKIRKVFKNIIIAESYILQEVEAPIQFDEDGNLLIKHITRFTADDYEREYIRSHKILEIADKSNNIESMKYELAKLWFLNLSIENKLKNRFIKKEPWIKVRSKILTDFNKYLKIVNKKDPSFVFGEYYNDTIYYNAYKTRINSATLGHSIKLLKDIIM